MSPPRQSVEVGRPERTTYALASAVNIIRIEASPTSTPMRYRSGEKRRGSSLPPPPGPPGPLGPPPPGPRPLPRPPRLPRALVTPSAVSRCATASLSPVTVTAMSVTTLPGVFVRGLVRLGLVRRRLQDEILGRA